MNMPDLAKLILLCNILGEYGNIIITKHLTDGHTQSGFSLCGLKVIFKETNVKLHVNFPEGTLEFCI